MKPSIGRVVHYVSYGTPGGEYKSECRAAVVTEVYWEHTTDEHGNKTAPSRPDPEQRVSLAVLNPTGMFFNQGVPHDELPPADKIVAGERTEHHGGTWHWPERVD